MKVVFDASASRIHVALRISLARKYINQLKVLKVVHTLLKSQKHKVSLLFPSTATDRN